MPLPASAGRTAPGSAHAAQAAARADPAAACPAPLVGCTRPAHRSHGSPLQVVPPHLLIIPVLSSVTRSPAVRNAAASADHSHPARCSHRPGRHPSALHAGRLYRPGRQLASRDVRDTASVVGCTSRRPERVSGAAPWAVEECGGARVFAQLLQLRQWLTGLPKCSRHCASALVHVETARTRVRDSLGCAMGSSAVMEVHSHSRFGGNVSIVHLPDQI